VILFTGIVQEIGTVDAVIRHGDSVRLRLRSGAVRDTAQPGDSISVSGVCLTVAELGAGCFTMDVGEETFRRTTLGGLRSGAAVNLEPALRLSDRLGGHIVTGHVDAIAAVRSVARETTQVIMHIELPPPLRPLVAPKGSITVDGISLTVGEVRGDQFSLFLIPHTVANTTLQNSRPGDKVNIEADVLARYVFNMLKQDGNAKGHSLFDLLQAFDYIQTNQ
jgi:riboflavin synthase